jgi:hypothetical protein
MLVTITPPRDGVYSVQKSFTDFCLPTQIDYRKHESELDVIGRLNFWKNALKDHIQLKVKRERKKEAAKHQQKEEKLSQERNKFKRL